MQKPFIFTLIVVSIFVYSRAKKINGVCNRKTENQLDVIFARILVYGQKGINFPETGQQLRAFCNEIPRMIEKTDRYSKECLNKFGKDSFSIILHSFKQEFKSVCKSGRVNKRAANLLEAAPCGNQGKDRFNENCYLKLIDGFMGAVNADIKRRVPTTCCHFFEFLHCWEFEAEKVPKCTSKIRDFFIKWLSKLFEGITQVMCTVYDESNSECDNIVKEAPKRNATQKRYKSVLLPLINIAMSLGDDQFPAN